MRARASPIRCSPRSSFGEPRGDQYKGKEESLNKKEKKKKIIKRNVYILPKHLDETVAAPHLDKLGAKLTTLSWSSRQTTTLRGVIKAAFKAEH